MLPEKAPNPPEVRTTDSRAVKMIRDVFESGRPLTYIRTSEEQRVALVLRELAKTLIPSTPVPLWTWSVTEGIRLEGGEPEAGTCDPRKVLDFIISYGGAAIFHLKDFHQPLRDYPEIRRRLRDFYAGCLDQRKLVVITSPVQFIPDELERSIMFLELRPPDSVELLEFLRREVSHGGGELSETALEQMIPALRGLTLDEARYALRRAQAAGHPLGPESIPALVAEKQLLIARTGYVECISDGKGMADIGGLETLKAWLLERRKLFQLRESLSEEIVPKGVLLMGIPGCGKSACVKAIASCFHLPLYRIDMIEIFSGRHGKPEGAFVAACKTMEEMAPAVLWFDEIEMGITSAESSGEQGRMFAFFLTWMQEKAGGLFVAATANRIDLLPAEMIRKGRFDEVFFVDLPSPEERLEIFRIHLKRRTVDDTGFDFQELMQFTNGWTGAEIEQCVVSGITKARLEDRKVTDRDLITIAARTIPLSRTMKEQISHIREWAFERAVRASPDATYR